MSKSRAIAGCFAISTWVACKRCAASSRHRASENGLFGFAATGEPSPFSAGSSLASYSGFTNASSTWGEPSCPMDTKDEVDAVMLGDQGIGFGRVHGILNLLALGVELRLQGDKIRVLRFWGHPSAITPLRFRQARFPRQGAHSRASRAAPNRSHILKPPCRHFFTVILPFEPGEQATTHDFLLQNHDGPGPEVETAAYRIVQEALTNVARHATVHEATIRLWIDEGSLDIQVEDRGRGFNLAASRTTSSPLVS
jgi:hypothetical protein